MTKRFFYTDPLAAAWMAKHFGLRFTDGTPDLYEVKRSSPSMFELDDGLNRYEYHGPFHIHPDSLHVLGPNVGDLIWSSRLIGHISAIGADRVLIEVSAGPIHASQIDVRDIALIQRNGIAFIWPESEA